MAHIVAYPMFHKAKYSGRGGITVEVSCLRIQPPTIMSRFYTMFVPDVYTTVDLTVSRFARQ
jgi:hypothetical protein